MHLVDPDGKPLPSAGQQAASIQQMAQAVIKSLRDMPDYQVQLDACHAYLAKTGAKPTGGQADTLATLKLMADFQKRAEDLIQQARVRAGMEGADKVHETTPEDFD